MALILYIDPVVEGQVLSPGQSTMKDDDNKLYTTKLVDFKHAISCIEDELARDKMRPLLSRKQLKLLRQQKVNLQGLCKVSKEGNVLQARLWMRQVSAVGLELQKEQDKLQERLIKQSTELFELRDRYEQALRTLKGKGKATEWK